MLPAAMLIDHDTGKRLPRPFYPELDACRCCNSSCQMWDGSSLVFNIGPVYVLDLNGIRSSIGLQLPGLTDLERARIDRRPNRNRLVQHHLVGVTIDLKPELLTVVVEETPLLATDATRICLVPPLKKNPAHHGVGATLFSQSSPKRLADSQITSDTHSVVPELITCRARRRRRTISPTASICTGVSVRQLVSVT